MILKGDDDKDNDASSPVETQGDEATSASSKGPSRMMMLKAKRKDLKAHLAKENRNKRKVRWRRKHCPEQEKHWPGPGQSQDGVCLVQDQ